MANSERAVLRGLAERVAEIAALPEQAAKREAVKALNRLDPVAPRIYCFPEGAWLECIPPAGLRCAGPVLRGWENRLRMAVYTHEELCDDFAILRACDCRAEMMVKDLHTVRHEPRRLRRWVELARQARDEVYG